MYIYNVTTQLTWNIHKSWLKWMQQEHIPEVLATGCFTHHRMVRVLEIDETDGPTYAVQYFTNTLGQYQSYLQNHSAALRQKAAESWKSEAISFRSLMEVVH